MPESIQKDTTVQVLEKGKIKHTNQQSQIFNAEDYIDIYNDTVQNLNMMHEQLENTEEEIMETLEENQDEMDVIHTLIEEEQQERADLTNASVSRSALNTYQQLQEKKNQKEQLQNQIAEMEDQVRTMMDAVENIAEPEDLESPQFTAEE